jgi:hypothetical protein
MTNATTTIHYCEKLHEKTQLQQFSKLVLLSLVQVRSAKTLERKKERKRERKKGRKKVNLTAFAWE